MKNEITPAYELYLSALDALVSDFKESQSVWIFGAGRAGWYIMKVMEHFNIPVNGFLDNDLAKQGRYAGYDVYGPDDVSNTVKQSHIILGTFRPETSNRIRDDLQNRGFLKLHQIMEVCLFAYFHSVVKRDCDMHILAESIAVLFESYHEKPDQYGYTQKGHFVSPFVTSNITQKCSIDCQDCGQLIPYYKSPVNFSVDTIVDDIKQYAKAFDVIPEMSLHGGEPLMNKNLADVCREVSKVPNIVFVSFLTNGTIVPSTKIMDALSATGAALQQSDYKTLSPKQSQIFDLCSEYGVYSDIVYTTSSGNWLRMPETKKHNRTKALNDEIYSECVNSKLCCQIMDGELHRCPYSMHSTRIGRIPKIDEDHVALLRADSEDSSLIDDIRTFLTRKDALSACDYCDPRNSIEVKPAIQLKKVKMTRKGRSTNGH